MCDGAPEPALASAFDVDVDPLMVAGGLRELVDALLGAIVVENIPAGAGTVGAGRIAEAAPDGYTIGIGDQTSFVISSVTTSVR